MLEVGNVLTLDDNKKYSVVFSTLLENINYILLIDQSDYTNTMFCSYDNENGLDEVVDENIIVELLKLYEIEKTKKS
ncbi:MAG: hypothetical protein IJO33_04100 [Bacilli bacterium]|nr:hypothetical protein [Bacilli bacterium]